MKKRKAFNKNKKLDALLIGSRYTFDVRDPLGDVPAVKNTGYGHANMNHYVICHIKAEVIGVDQIKDSDFNIKKRDAA
mgnify:CR=1 FL=1